MDGSLFYYLTLWQPLGYAIVFFGMMFEGDLILFLASFLAHQGVFNIFFMTGIVFFGAILGDLLWYWIGEHALERFRVTRWINHLSKPFDDHIAKRPFHAIFISKFMYGFNHAILMRAGALKINKFNFITTDIMATIVWMCIVGGLGYFSGVYLSLIKHYVRNAEILVLAIVFAYFVFDKLITEFLKKKL